MKIKQFLFLVVVSSGLFSCSREFENKTTEYVYNTKGFFNSNDDDGDPVYNLFTLSQVTDDWDGDGDEYFKPDNKNEKIIKVDLSGRVSSSLSGKDLGGINSAMIILYDHSTKKAYRGLSSLTKMKPTFQGGFNTSESGYVVYRVPRETKINDLYIGIDDEEVDLSNLKEEINKELDWSKKDVNDLLPLKPFEVPAEKKVNVNIVKNIDNWRGKRTYTFKDFTNYVNDDFVKKHIKEESEAYGLQNSDVFFKLDIDLEVSEDMEYMETIYLVTEYGYSSPIEKSVPKEIKAGERISLSLYYAMPPYKIRGIEIDGELIELK